MKSPPVLSSHARATVFASFIPGAAALAIASHDFVLTPLFLAFMSGGHALSWRWRTRTRRRLEIVPGVLAGAALAAYYVAGWIAGNMRVPLNPASLVLAMGVVASPYLATRRQLFASMLLSLYLVFWVSWIAFGWAFAAVAAAWVSCFFAFRHFVLLEEQKAKPAWPSRASLGFQAACLLLGSGLYVLVPVPITASVGPTLFDPPVYPVAISVIAPSRLPLTDAQPVGANLVIEAKTPLLSYWRAEVFDVYNGGAWSRASARTVTGTIDQARLTGLEGPSLGRVTEAYAVNTALAGPLVLSQPVEHIYYPRYPVVSDIYFDYFVPGGSAPGAHYSGVSWIPDWSAAALQQPPAGGDEPDPVLLDAAALSAANRSLAKAAATGTADRYQATLAVTRYLKTHYQLVASPAAAVGADPVRAFLDSTGAGDSLDFATAGVLMLRSLGIPARLATGYVPSERNPLVGEASARQRDWHAWMEVRFPGHGWVPFDPTPGFSDLPAPRLVGRTSLEWIAPLVPNFCAIPIIQFFFEPCPATSQLFAFPTSSPAPVVSPPNTPSAGPTPTAIRSPRPSGSAGPTPTAIRSPRPSGPTATSTKSPTSSPTSSAVAQLITPGPSPSPPLPTPLTAGDLGIGLATFSFLLVLGALLFLVFAARRRKKGDPEVVQLYGRMQKRLPRPRHPSETPLEYADAMSSTPLRNPLERLTRLLNLAVFAGTKPPRDEILAVEREIDTRGKRK